MIPIGVLGAKTDVIQHFIEYSSKNQEFNIVFSGQSLNALNQLKTEKEIQIIIVTFKNKLQALDSVAATQSLNPNVLVILLMEKPEFDFILRSIRLGIDGILEKDVQLSDLMSALWACSKGGAPISPTICRIILDNIAEAKQELLKILTERENEVLHLVVEGFANKLIAEKLHIGLETVRTHIKNICKKFDVNSKAEVVCRLLREKIAINRENITN